jgi:hypothetical protein
MGRALVFSGFCLASFALWPPQDCLHQRLGLQVPKVLELLPHCRPCSGTQPLPQMCSGSGAVIACVRARTPSCPPPSYQRASPRINDDIAMPRTRRSSTEQKCDRGSNTKQLRTLPHTRPVQAMPLCVIDSRNRSVRKTVSLPTTATGDEVRGRPCPLFVASKWALGSGGRLLSFTASLFVTPPPTHNHTHPGQLLAAIKNKLRFKPGKLYSLDGEEVSPDEALTLSEVLVARCHCAFVSPALSCVDVHVLPQRNRVSGRKSSTWGPCCCCVYWCTGPLAAPGAGTAHAQASRLCGGTEGRVQLRLCPAHVCVRVRVTANEEAGQGKGSWALCAPRRWWTVGCQRSPSWAATLCPPTRWSS